MTTPLNLTRWKELADAAIPGYVVTENGEVFSTASNWRGHGLRQMKSFPNDDGYLRVHLTIRGQRRNFLVHKLVAMLYQGPRPPGKNQICHIDGNKLNNAAKNLRYGSAKDNADDRQRHGRTAAGEKNGMYRTHCIKGHSLDVHGRKRKTGGGRECLLCAQGHRLKYEKKIAREALARIAEMRRG